MDLVGALHLAFRVAQEFLTNLTKTREYFRVGLQVEGYRLARPKPYLGMTVTLKYITLIRVVGILVNL